MKLVVRIFTTALLVLLIGHFMTGIHIVSFTTAIIVAIVLGLLNVFIKPILVTLTFPVTIVTLGLFLLVINAVIVLLCTKFVNSFHVDTFWTALLFSIVLSILQSIANKIIGED